MKKLLIVFGLLLNFYGISQITESEDLMDLCRGSVLAFNEIWSVYPKSSITVKNQKTGDIVKTECIIINDLKKSTTAVILKIHSNLAVVFGYKPGISGEYFDDNGEFFMCERRNGDINDLEHFYEPMKSFASNNEKIYYIEKNNIQVYAENRIEVRMFKFNNLGLTYILPEH